jgi:hypothetical protein
MKGLDHPNIGKLSRSISLFTRRGLSSSSETIRSYRNGENSLSRHGVCQWRFDSVEVKCRSIVDVDVCL